MRKDKKRGPDMEQTYDTQAHDFAAFAPRSFQFVNVERPAWDRHIARFYGPDTRALDLGAGGGRMAGLMVERGIPPANITGVELSAELVKEARRRVPGVNFVHGDIRGQINLPSDSLDLITSHMVLEFLDDEGLEAALRNSHRLLKPGATLCFITTHSGKMTASDGVTQRGWFETTAPWGVDTKIQNWFRTKEDFVAALDKTGFEIASVEELTVPPEAEAADPAKYRKYHAYGPIRLLIEARKPRS